MGQNSKDFYTEAHIFVAAVRICEHLHSTPPTLEEVCQTLRFSTEQAGFIGRRLEQMGILEAVQGSYGARFFIRDHRKLEEIPRGEVGSRLEEEVKKFQDAQKTFSKKIESLQAEQAGKKKSRFADMEKKLKEELEKKSRS